MNIGKLPLRIAGLVSTKEEMSAGLEGQRLAPHEFPGVDSKVAFLIKLADNFMTGAENDWGVMRWRQRTTGSGNVSLLPLSLATMGGSIVLATGATSGSVAELTGIGPAANILDHCGAVSFLFHVAAPPAGTSGEVDAILRMGFKTQDAGTHFFMVESNASNSPHTWRVRYNPSSGGSLQEVDTEVDVTSSLESYNGYHIYQVSVIGRDINEHVFGGEAGKSRVIICGAGATNAVKLYDAEITLTGTVIGARPFIGIENTGSANRLLLPAGAVLWHMGGYWNVYA